MDRLMGSQYRTAHNGKRRSFFCTRKLEQFILLIHFVFLSFLTMLFIVKNGNILTDGRDERKYLQIKYNEL